MQRSTPERWTVLALINWAKEYFARNGVESPRLAAEILLAHALGCARIDLYVRFDELPSAEQRGRFRELIRRAAEGEPVAYLVGCKEFYSLTFAVTPDVLIPRPETELLVSEAMAYLEAHPERRTVWDVCTGCGCVAVAVAVNCLHVSVLATDVSPEAVELAGRNAEAHGVADRVRCCTADLLDRPASYSEPERVDVLTANPPYVADTDDVADSVHREPRGALRGGPEGMDFIEPIIRGAPQVLSGGGALILEFGCGQADAVRDRIVEARVFDEPRIVRDHQGLERVAVAIRRS